MVSATIGLAAETAGRREATVQRMDLLLYQQELHLYSCNTVKKTSRATFCVTILKHYNI